MKRTRFTTVAAVLIALAAASAAQAATWWIATNGSDANAGSEAAPFATFQHAIDVAQGGDTVMAKAGVYYGAGNEDVDAKGKAITITSQAGAETTIVDLSLATGKRFIRFVTGETWSTQLIGFTIRHGEAPSSGATGGGAILISSAPTIQHCVFEDCYAPGAGGAIYVGGTAWGIVPRIEYCRFVGNSAAGAGGAVYTDSQAMPFILHCRFEGNTSPMHGGAVGVGLGAHPTLENCILAGNTAGTGGGNGAGGAVSVIGAALVRSCTFDGNTAGSGAAVSVTGAGADLTFVRNMVTFNHGAAVACAGAGETSTWTCNNFWGNTGGDFVAGGGCDAQSIGPDNFFEYPRYCPGDDFTLSVYSPGAPANNACGELIGAGAVVCDYYICGDVDPSGGIDIADLLFLVEWMFNGGPAPVPLESADLNCSGTVDISDLLYMVDYIFQGGPAPCDCGAKTAAAGAAAGEAVLNVAYAGGETVLRLQADAALRGVEIAYAGAAASLPADYPQGVRGFDRADGAGRVLGFADLDGRGRIAAGTVELARIPGRVEVTAAKAVAADGRRLDVRFAGRTGAAPATAKLESVYPNPFNPMTRFMISVPTEQHVDLAVYDVRGRRIATLIDASLGAGSHDVTWQGRDDAGSPVPAGVYFARFASGGHAETHKLMLLK